MYAAKNYTVKELKNRLRRSSIAPAGIDKMRKQNLINYLSRAGQLAVKASHPLNSKTVPQLRQMLTNKGHTGVSKLVKANLIALLNSGRSPVKKVRAPPVKKARSPLFKMPVTYINSPLSALNKKALIAKAGKVGIVGRHKMKKNQLINKLRSGVSPASTVVSVRTPVRNMSTLKGILKESGLFSSGPKKAVKFSRLTTKLGFGVAKSPRGNMNNQINKPTKKYANRMARMNNRPKPVSRFNQMLASISTRR